MAEVTFSDFIKQLAAMTKECMTSYEASMPGTSSSCVARAKMVVNNFNMGFEEIEDELQDIIEEMMSSLEEMHEDVTKARKTSRYANLFVADQKLQETLKKISDIMQAIEQGSLELVRQTKPPKNVAGSKYKVFLDNDDVNTFEHVVAILGQEFGMSEYDASIAAQEIHVYGTKCVSEHMTVAEAEEQDTRLQGYGLTSHFGTVPTKR